MPNPIVIENKREGTSNWELTHPAIAREIEGYASLSSVNKGKNIDLFISTAAAQFSFEVYRMGWYNGTGGRLVYSSTTHKGILQDTPSPDENGMAECNWKNEITLTIGTDWTTGVHVVKLQEHNTNKESYIIFVVRDDDAPSDICFQLPVTTYQAYNYWGGKSLYPEGSGSLKNWGFGRGKHANKLSFNRPYYRSTNIASAKGMGAGEFFSNVQPNASHGYPISAASWDYNMVRWLEKNGYDLNYITSLDTHHSPKLVAQSKIFLSQGHDEYWSMDMRKNVEQARDKNTNLTFFSSNAMFWQIRIEPSKLATSAEHRTIVCYKEKENDPIKGIKTSINYRDIPDIESEAAVLGVQYSGDPVFGDITIDKQDHWIFKNTDLKKGSKLKGLLGYEVDSVAEHSPKNTLIVANSTYRKRCEHWLCARIRFLTKKVPQGHYLYFGEGNSSISQPKTLLLVYGGLIALTAMIYPVFGIWALLVPFLFITGLIGLTILSTFKSPKRNSHMSYYTTNNNTQVFATGSMQWSWGLDDYNAPRLRKSYYNENAVQITKNVLSAFGAKTNS